MATCRRCFQRLKARAYALLFALAFLQAETHLVFVQRIPNGDAATRRDSGITCLHLGHEGCLPGAARNSFGQDFHDSGNLMWTVDLCKLDSDGDGLANGEELGDPCCLWNMTGNVPPGFRTHFLSHPGDSASIAPVREVACPIRQDFLNDKPSPSVSVEGPVEQVDENNPAESNPLESTQDGFSNSDETSEPDISSSNQPSIEPDRSDDTDGNRNDDNASACFPAAASVQLESGKKLPIEHLKVGDRILVALNTYSEVFMFSHADHSATTRFVQIHTARQTEGPLVISSGHYVHVSGRGLVAASAIRQGDKVVVARSNAKMSLIPQNSSVYTSAMPKEDTVVGISRKYDRGLYNPHTLAGDIVVNGIVCSTFTTAVRPAFANKVLIPLRLAYSKFSISLPLLCVVPFQLHDWLVQIVPRGSQFEQRSI